MERFLKCSKVIEGLIAENEESDMRYYIIGYDSWKK